MFDTLVRGGEVVCEGSVVQAEIGIQSGRIAALLARGATAEARQVIEASGKHVIPGAIDAHLHFKTFDHQVDTFETASISAAHGGITTVIPFIKGREGMKAVEFLEHFRLEGESTSVLDFGMHIRLSVPDPAAIAEIADAVAMGVSSVKVMMAYRKRGIMWDEYHLLAGMEATARAGGIFMVHAEDGLPIDYLEDKLLAEGRYGAATFLASRPNALEASAIARAAMLAEMAGCRLHIVHLSAREGLVEIQRARARGQQVTTETCPQYLLLTDADTRRLGGRAKIGPPLRQAPDLEAMWGGLRRGDIEMVASDHAPCAPEAKDLPDSRYVEIPYGAPSVETMLPLLYSEGVMKGRLSLERLADALCTSPARVFGLYPRKGTIKVGADADLVLLDPTIEWQIAASQLHSQTGYTPYEGWRVRGKPVLSLLRGQVLLQDGQLVQKPGFGQYIPRPPAV